jgi:hypothetical protein
VQFLGGGTPNGILRFLSHSCRTTVVTAQLFPGASAGLAATPALRRRLRGVPSSHRRQHAGAETLRHGSVLVAPTHPAVDQPQMRSPARTRYVLDATLEVRCRPGGKLGVGRRLFDLGQRDRVFARCLPRQHGDHEECASGWKKLAVCEHAAPHEGPWDPRDQPVREIPAKLPDHCCGGPALPPVAPCAGAGSRTASRRA